MRNWKNLAMPVGLLAVLAVTAASPGAVIYTQNFESTAVGADPTNWTDTTGHFGVIDTAGDHEYQGDGQIVNSYISSSPFPVSDYIYRVEARYPVSTNAGILGRVVDATHYYYLQIDPDRQTVNLRKDAGTTLASATLPQALAGEKIYLFLIFQGTTITGKVASLSDPLAATPLATVSATNSAYASGGVGFRDYKAQGIYDDVIVVESMSDIPEPATMTVLGAGALLALLRRRR